MMQKMEIYSVLFVAFLALAGAAEEVPQSAAHKPAELPSIPVALALKLNARVKRQPQRQPWTTQRALINRISSYDDTSANLSDCMRYCPTTSQWKPVCGTDNLSYANINKLRCAQLCGKQVSYVYNGSCVTTEPPTNTSPNYYEYNNNNVF